MVNIYLTTMLNWIAIIIKLTLTPYLFRDCARVTYILFVAFNERDEERKEKYIYFLCLFI